MQTWIKRLFCAHAYIPYRNLYGDEICVFGGKRSIWECVKCGHEQFRDGLADLGPTGKD